MKKAIYIFLLLIFLAAAWLAYLFLGSTTAFEGRSKFLYIHTGKADRESILATLEKDSLVSHPRAFAWLADKVGYFEKAKPGKYKVEDGMSIYALIRKLRRGRQEEVKLVIGKIRLPEEAAQKLAKYIEQDSAAIMAYLYNEDTLKKYGVTKETWMCNIIPNTYNIYWTNTAAQVFQKLFAAKDKWWLKENRLQKASSLGLETDEIYTIASIVEEETNMQKDKPLVASVYMNRLRKGMPLQADPTVRFALKDFASNRVTYNMLKTSSPYNTYLNKGLPPGPICIPSIQTLEAVLNAPATDYLYFVAKPDFSGYSTFTKDYKEHTKAAKIYQDSLNAWLLRKAAKQANATGK